jgi:protein phosphatase PTC2/3
VGYHGIGPLG